MREVSIASIFTSKCDFEKQSSKYLIYQKKSLYLRKIKQEEIMFGKIINIDPEILGGTPVFSGTRVPVKNLFDYLEAGKSIDTFVDDFDTISKEQIIQFLELTNKLIISSTQIFNENFA